MDVSHLEYKLVADWDMFAQAMEKVKQENVVGMRFEGPYLSRNESPLLVSVATRSQVYLIDTMEIKGDCYRGGLGRLLEEEGTVKVVYDCRRASDSLFHRHGIRLCNIFDTQVADLMIQRDMGADPPKIRELSKCLKVYLGISKEEAKDVGCVMDCSKNQMWDERPLQPDTLHMAYERVRSLRALKVAQNEVMMRRLTQGVDVFLSTIRDASEEDAEMEMSLLHEVPEGFVATLEQNGV